jgi:MoxR-like ATPase
MILADEINRTPPKTQAALLEAMQEHQVTASGVRHPLEEPFFRPRDAEPDRDGRHVSAARGAARSFHVQRGDGLPARGRRSAGRRADHVGRPAAIEALFTGEDVLRFHDLVRKVPVAEEMVRYAVQLAAGSRPHQPNTPDFVNEWVSWGAGTRAGQFMILGAKARALLRGRAHVTVEDIQVLAIPALRHRILLNYRAEAEGIKVDEVVKRLLAATKAPVKSS